jgi:hypothetical protein
MILLLDVQRKSIVVAAGMKEAIDMASFGAPNWEIVSSINAEMRRMIEERVIAEYKKVAAEAVNRRMAPVSGLGPA